jgi:hypothetical protein
MDPQDVRHVYVVDEQSRVWASLDAGHSWRELTANLSTLLPDARTVELFSPAYGGKMVLIVGGLGGVFQLSGPGTPGALWSRLGSNLPHGLVLDLRYNYRAKVLVAGILGRGAWTLTDSFTGGGHGAWASAAEAVDGSATGPALQMALPANMPKAAPRPRLSGSKAAAPATQ